MAGRDERQHTGNRNQGGRKQGKAQGGHHHNGANKPVGINAEQRKALAKVRSVIPKDKVSRFLRVCPDVTGGIIGE